MAGGKRETATGTSAEDSSTNMSQKERANPAVWTTKQDKYLLNLLNEEKNAGNMSENSFKMPTLIRVAAKIKVKFPSTGISGGLQNLERVQLGSGARYVASIFITGIFDHVI